MNGVCSCDSKDLVVKSITFYKACAHRHFSFEVIYLLFYPLDSYRYLFSVAKTKLTVYCNVDPKIQTDWKCFKLFFEFGLLQCNTHGIQIHTQIKPWLCRCTYMCESHWYAWVKACYWSLWARLGLIKESNEIRGRGVVERERCSDGCGKEDGISMKSISEGGREIKLEDERGLSETLESLEQCRGSIRWTGREPQRWYPDSQSSRLCWSCRPA